MAVMVNAAQLTPECGQQALLSRRVAKQRLDLPQQRGDPVADSAPDDLVMDAFVSMHQRVTKPDAAPPPVNALSEIHILPLQASERLTDNDELSLNCRTSHLIGHILLVRHSTGEGNDSPASGLDVG